MLKNRLGNHINSKIFLAGISFFAGITWGYLLGRLNIQIFILQLPKISINPNWLLRINPNPTFLSDVAAFEAAIIAFLVPLSIEIISKISERYSSDVITRVFENRWENKILPPVLLINILAAVALRFLVKEGVDSLGWKIVAWIILSVFMIIAFAIWRVIIRIKLFVSDTTYVMNQLYKDVEKSLE